MEAQTIRVERVSFAARLRELAALLSLCLSASSCGDPCGTERVSTSHGDKLSCSGALLAPSGSGLAPMLPAVCTHDTGCIPTTACLMSPATCAQTCLEVDVPSSAGDFAKSLQISLTLDSPQQLQSVTLPDARVGVKMTYFDSATGAVGTVLTAGSGMLSTTFTMGHLTATFSIDATTSAGDNVMVTSATYDVTDEVVTQCLAN